MIKVLIVDDEPSAVNTLVLLLERYVPEATHIEKATSPIDALKLISVYKPQLVFLDIQMPRMNGFEFLRKAAPLSFDVIFTTAYDHYAIQAIRYSALDYLLKPIDATELRAAVNRFIVKRSEKQSQTLIDNLLVNVQSSEQQFKLAIHTLEGTFFFRTDEITRLEAEGSYTRFFFLNRKPLLASRVLKDFDEMLQAQGFIRTHKTHLVNRAFVRAIHPDGFLELADESRIEVSRRRRSEVQAALMK